MGDDKAKKITDRRRASMDYWDPIYQECTEVQQALKCKTDPIFKKDANGKDTTEEDKTRTNVCMPGLSIMARKNVARMTANAPNINFIAQNSTELAEKLSAWSRMQYDLTNEADVIRKHVMQAEAFGFSVVKIFQNDVTIKRQVRARTLNATRTALMKAKGHPESEIQDAVNAFGDKPTAEEVSAAQQEYGNEFSYEIVRTKFSGPTAKWIFLGDFHMPPGCDALDNADWVIEEYVETPAWFDSWAGKSYKDKKTGEELPVLDAAVVKEITDADESIPKKEKDGLREKFLNIQNLDSEQSTYDVKKLSCGKKFSVMECHERRDDGLWIVFVVNDKHFVGEMPYPVDFNGQFMYTDLVPLPDLTSAIGDSTPRLGRFLHRLHNHIVGARTDYVNQQLRPLVFTQQGADIPDEAVQRGLMQEVQVRRISDVQVERPSGTPPAFYEQESAVLRMMGMLEPSMTSADTAGTNANPQQGKTATVGVLAQRERDSLLAFKIEGGLNLFWKKHEWKKLTMLQQTMQDPVQIPQKYLSAAFLDNLKQQAEQQQQDPGLLAKVSQKIGQMLGVVPKEQAVTMSGGHAQIVELDWEELQTEIDAEPEAGSTLSKEDEFHAMRAQQFFAMAAANPDVFDKWYAGGNLASTVKGVDPKLAVNPKPAPEPPMPKIQGNVNIPFDKLTPMRQEQMFQYLGFEADPSAPHREILHDVKLLGEAADGAGKLAEPVNSQSEGGLRRTAADRVGSSGSGAGSNGKKAGS